MFRIRVQCASTIGFFFWYSDHFMFLLRFQYSKIIQNPSHLELQKAANQGRRCTWEKLSAIKANCGIELALDESVAILNHMRRLKRSAERAGAASQGLTCSARFNAPKRIPSWNLIARDNSTGSLEELLLSDVASSLHQGVSGRPTRQSNQHRRAHRNTQDGSDSESESANINSWTRSGGPLMRTTSADMFIDFFQNLENGMMVYPNNISPQADGVPHYQSPRVVTPDRSSDTDLDQRDLNNGVARSSSSIMVAEGDFLQPERIHNGILFNVVKKEVLSPSHRSHESENSTFAECMQLDCLDKEMDSSSTSEVGDNDSALENGLNETGSVCNPKAYLVTDDGNDEILQDN